VQQTIHVDVKNIFYVFYKSIKKHVLCFKKIFNVLIFCSVFLFFNVFVLLNVMFFVLGKSLE